MFAVDYIRDLCGENKTWWRALRLDILKFFGLQTWTITHRICVPQTALAPFPSSALWPSLWRRAVDPAALWCCWPARFAPILRRIGADTWGRQHTLYSCYTDFTWNIKSSHFQGVCRVLKNWICCQVSWVVWKTNIQQQRIIHQINLNLFESIKNVILLIII